jgi:KDEL-tailed cysteine endopeptidase
MRKGFASLAVVGIAACVAVFALTQSPKSNSLYSNALTAEDMEFIKYVAKFGKSYGTKEEFEFRSDLFKKNLALLAEENSRNDNTFTVGINKFADWTPSEYRRMLSYKPTRGAKLAAENFNVSIPSSIDWRTEGAVNPVKDQGQCGSCWAFSAVGVLESRYKINKGTLFSLSEQQLVDCATGSPYSSEGCNGGEMTDGFDYAAAKGMMTESDYPYKAYDQSCKYDSSKVTPVKGLGHVMVSPNSANALKTAIAAGPVSVAIEADTFVFQFYSGGILNSKNCGTDLDHGVVAVGYGVDATKGEYYIVRNSWGASWGVKGYVNIAIVDGQGICGIQMEPTFANF